MHAIFFFLFLKKKLRVEILGLSWLRACLWGMQKKPHKLGFQGSWNFHIIFIEERRVGNK